MRITAGLSLCLYLTTFSAASADILWECPKTFTMSSAVGITNQYNGTDYIRYSEGQFICVMMGPDSDKCFVKYTNILETSGAVVGFERQTNHPKDTEVIVLDLLNRRFYKTYEQGKLRVTIFGDCQKIGENRLQVTKTLKDDALFLLGLSTFVTGISQYCNKRVAKNEELINATVRWKKRNEPYRQRINQIIKSEGGLPKFVKKNIVKMAVLMAKNEAKNSGDQNEYCSDVAITIDSGLFDLDKLEEAKEALARIMRD